VTTEKNQALVHASGVSCRFGAFPVFEDLTLTLSRGVVGILGPNGAGKTTLIRTLASVLPIQKGSVVVDGHDLSDPASLRAARREIGYLPQVFGFHGGFTAQEFVEYLAWLKEVPRDRRAEAVAWSLEQVGLDGRSGVKMRRLSGGMRRRVGIAQAIVNRPRLLLLDEPTAGLDPEQRITFRRLLRQLGESSSVVVATHLVEDVAAACDRVVVFSQGVIRFDGTPDALGALGDRADVEGDSPIERGYLAAVMEEI
jgi:ABC-2 type transport system ATP-binding protein